MQQLRRDNHYVPEVYLKQLAHQGKILTYRLLVPHDKCPLWKAHSVAGIAYHQHLYTYFSGQGDTDEVERWLDREFESPAQEVIRRVVQEESLRAEDWRILIRFAVAQQVRTPASMKAFFDRQERTLQTLMAETMTQSVRKLEQAYESGTRPILAEADVTNPLPLKISITPKEDGEGIVESKTIIGRRLWLWQVRHILSRTLARLPRHHWTILHAPAGITWPTSDNPVILLNFISDREYDFKGGWGRKKGDIILPLSPKHLMYTCIGERSLLRGTVLDEKTALLMRRIIIEHADRYIFATEPSDIQLIRPRVVSPEACRQERQAWQNWHEDQRQAEAELLA